MVTNLMKMMMMMMMKKNDNENIYKMTNNEKMKRGDTEEGE